MWCLCRFPKDNFQKTFDTVNHEILTGTDPEGVDGVASHPPFQMEKKIKKVGFPQTLS